MKPNLIAYSVKGEGEKSFWTKIGAAWENKDEKGFNIVLDTIPLDGKISLREAKED